MRPVWTSPSPTPGTVRAVVSAFPRAAEVACSASPRVLRSRLTPTPIVAVSLGIVSVAEAVTVTVLSAALAAAGNEGEGEDRADDEDRADPRGAVV